MDVLAKSRETLEALTTFPYYVVMTPTTGHASWQEASAIAFALECIGSSSGELPSLALLATKISAQVSAMQNNRIVAYQLGIVSSRVISNDRRNT
jgi:predicted aconitase